MQGERNAPRELRERIREMVVRAVCLKIPPESLPFDRLLFDGSLGLDSIDALEIAVTVEKEFKVRLDEKEARDVLSSVETIAAFIERTRN
ncbi:MAG: hypothetical protein A2Z34_05855 [Planctomycetes bacterium RBG_16_59_8]|nr:MAG: hypothetical protein A2Z34_05855 [Planctomycetes bacterium RBG_16_59_8]